MFELNENASLWSNGLATSFPNSFFSTSSINVLLKETVEKGFIDIDIGIWL